MSRPYQSEGRGVNGQFLPACGLSLGVTAGTASIPRELVEVSMLARLSLVHRWRKLILPAIFPQLLTSWITARARARG